MQPEVEVHQGVAQPTAMIARERYFHTYDRRINIGLGVMQVVCGLILIAFTVSTDSLHTHFYYMEKEVIED